MRLASAVRLRTVALVGAAPLACAGGQARRWPAAAEPARAGAASR